MHWFLIILIGVPVAEILIFIEVGNLFNPWAIVTAVVLTAYVGVALIRKQGPYLIANTINLAEGPLADRALFNGVWVVLSGLCLVAPGFLTDSIGISLFITPFRRMVLQNIFNTAIIKSPSRHWKKSTAHRAHNQNYKSEIIDGEFQDLTSKNKKSSD